MALDLVDMIWSAMRKSEFYSPSDLSNVLGEPTDTIVRVLEFLTRYGFMQEVSKRELIFRKVVSVPSPGNALRILHTVIKDAPVGTGPVTSISKILRKPTVP